MEELKCYVGMHKYKIYAEKEVADARGNAVGAAIVSVCERCGKVKVSYVRTVSEQRC